ncbi:MAG: (d)CMP kinase, partial [Cyanobacteria bacterium REEB65]|nr:(d)CMP kinase [Cyanobacteria bacterium REEB65]
VARVPAVREAMVQLQRQLGEDGGIVAEGRDMGTVVFPYADLKIYLEASPGERARRRAQDLAEGGHSVDLAELETEIRQRDHLDSTRQVAPLAAAVDAVRVATDELSAEQVVDRILALAGRAGNQPQDPGRLSDI